MKSSVFLSRLDSARLLALSHPCNRSSIGYAPFIQAPPTEMSAIYIYIEAHADSFGTA